MSETMELEKRAESCVEQLADATALAQMLAELGRLGSVALPAVVAGLLDGRWRVRKGCAVALTVYGDGNAYDLLLPLSNDPKADVRLWSLHALAAECSRATANVTRLVPLLIERATRDKSVRVRRAAVQLLALHPLGDGTEALFRALLEESDVKLRRLARWALEKGGAQ